MTANAQTPRTCEHGQLARQCEICDLQRELAAVRGQLEELQKNCDRLTGMKFSDRMHAALVDRAERAESALDAAKAEAERYCAALLKVRVALTGDLHGEQDLVAEAEALREKLHNISNEFPAVYQRGLRDGIKQGLLRAAEICDYHDNEDDQGYGAWKAAAAIRAEAEKEGK